MELDKGKQRFIQSWGAFGSSWGINRTMAQVHALLLISRESLTAEGIMEELQISRGNANMNVRTLIDWGLVYKDLKPGERKEYFYAEKEMSTVVKQIITHRKKKELEPMIRVLDEIVSVESQCPDSDQFCTTVRDIKLFASKADSMLDKLIKADSNWLMSTFMKMVK